MGNLITRLNSAIRNRHYFFLWPIFIYQQFVTNSGSHAYSGNIKNFVPFPGNSILKISLRFWNCVGCCNMCGKPTQFQPPQFSIFGQFFIQNHISSVALYDFLVRIFWSRSQVCSRMPTYSNAHAKVKKWIFEVQFPDNWFEFDIIVNDFRKWFIRWVEKS